MTDESHEDPDNDNTTMFTDAGDDTFGTAEDFVMHEETTDAGIPENTRMSGILAGTDTIDDTELLTGATPVAIHRTPQRSPLRKQLTPARRTPLGRTKTPVAIRSPLSARSTTGRSSRSRVPFRMTPQRVAARATPERIFPLQRKTNTDSDIKVKSLLPPLNTLKAFGTRTEEEHISIPFDNETDAIGAAVSFLQEYNLRHYKADNPFIESVRPDGEEVDGDLTFTHVTFWGKDIPDREELEALEQAKYLDNPSARLIQRLVSTNAIQRRFIRQQNRNWADLADAEREDDHRRVSEVQKVQGEAIRKLHEERIKLMEEIVTEKEQNDELNKEISKRDQAIRNFKSLICQNEKLSAAEIDTDEALALLDELFKQRQAIVKAARKIESFSDDEEAIASAASFIEQLVAGKEEVESLARLTGGDLDYNATFSDAVKALRSFVEKKTGDSVTSSRVRHTGSSLRRNSSISIGGEHRGFPAGDDAIDEVPKESLQYELNVRTAELDKFAVYAKELDPGLDPVASASDILNFFKSRISRVAEERVFELENEVKEYEELYRVQNGKTSLLEDNYEKAQSRIASLESELSKEREKHDKIIKELESNTQNAVADLEEHARALEERDAELKSLNEELVLLKKMNEDDGIGPDHASFVRLEIKNKQLAEKCTEFERNMRFWKEQATKSQRTKRPREVVDENSLPSTLPNDRYSIGSGAFSALAKRIEILSEERSSLLEKTRQMKDDLIRREKIIAEMRAEFAAERETLQKLLDHAKVELEDMKQSMKNQEKANTHWKDERGTLSDDDTFGDESSMRLSLEITEIIRNTSWDDKSIEAAVHSLDALIGAKDDFVGRTNDLVAKLKLFGHHKGEVGQKERSLLAMDSRTTLEKFSAIFKMQQNLIRLLRGRTWSNARRLSRTVAVSGDGTITNEIDWTIPPAGLSPLKSPIADGDHTVPQISGIRHAARARKGPLVRPVRRSSVDRVSSANRTFEYMKVQLDETRNLLRVQESETQSLREMVAKTEANNVRLQEDKVQLQFKMRELKESTSKFLKKIATVAEVEPTQYAIERFCVTAMAEKGEITNITTQYLLLQGRVCALIAQKSVLSRLIEMFHAAHGISILGKREPLSLRSAARAIIWIKRLSILSGHSSVKSEQNILVKASSMYDIPNVAGLNLSVSYKTDIGDLWTAYNKLPHVEHQLRAREAKIADMAKALALLENTAPLEQRGLTPVRSLGEDYNQDIMRRKNELAALLEQKIDDLMHKYNEECKLRVAAEANVTSYVRKLASMKKKIDKVKARASKREMTYKAAIRFLKEKADEAASNPRDETVVFAFNEEMEKLKEDVEKPNVVVYNKENKENDDRAVELLEQQISQLREEAQSISADPWLKEQNKEYISGMTRAVRKIKRFAEKYESREKQQRANFPASSEQ